VLSVGDGIARVYGLDNVQAGEMVEFENATRGMALNLETDNVGIVIFGNDREIRKARTVKRTGSIVDVPVGKGLLGRVVDALGNPIDGKGPIKADKRERVDVKAPGIIPRKSVNEPMATGLKAIDAFNSHRPRPARVDHRRPSDRQDRDRARHHPQSKAAECADGRRRSSFTAFTSRSGRSVRPLRSFVKVLEEQGALDYSIIIAATASDPAPMRFLAPFSGCTWANISATTACMPSSSIDDLSKQAVAYRQMSAAAAPATRRGSLSRDVFLFAFALARAPRQDERRQQRRFAHRAWPIIETQANDVSAYIPTNVISITDGQIFLETDLFYQGIRPAGERRLVGVRASARPRRPRR